jgi:hypothetical protein
MCLYGQYLVTNKKRYGFVLWIVADAIWTVANFMQYKTPGCIEQGTLWLLYTVVSIWGWFKWKKQTITNIEHPCELIDIPPHETYCTEFLDKEEMYYEIPKGGVNKPPKNIKRPKPPKLPPKKRYTK